MYTITPLKNVRSIDVTLSHPVNDVRSIAYTPQSVRRTMTTFSPAAWCETGGRALSSSYFARSPFWLKNVRSTIFRCSIYPPSHPTALWGAFSGNNYRRVRVVEFSGGGTTHSGTLWSLLCDRGHPLPLSPPSSWTLRGLPHTCLF